MTPSPKIILTHSSGTLPTLDTHDWPTFQPGWVWMAGGGPGDPGLLTLHALNALKQADVIVHDALVDPALLCWARDDAKIEFAGKRGGKPSPKATRHLASPYRACTTEPPCSSSERR